MTTPEDFGAIGDGFLANGSVNPTPTDNQTALQAFLNAVATSGHGEIGAARYCHSGQLVWPNANDCTIKGANRYRSQLCYTGSATQDIHVFGNTSHDTRGWVLDDFMITSTTQMTGGYAFKATRAIFCEFDIVLTGFYGPGGDGLRGYSGVPLWNGWYFAGSLYCFINNSDIKVKNNGLSVCALPAPGQGTAGIFVQGGRLCAGNIGVLAGGGANIYLDEIDIIACAGAGFRADTSLVSIGNNQMFFGPNLSFDQNGAANIILNDALAGYQHLQINGTWSASSLSHGFHVIKWGNGSGAINATFGRNTNNQADGVRIEDPSVTCIIDGLIDHNQGYGLKYTPAVTQPFSNVRLAPGARIVSNSAGAVSGVVDGYPRENYRRTGVAFTTPSGATTQIPVAHGFNQGVTGFGLQNHLVRAEAWYLSSSGFRVALTIWYCDPANFYISPTLPAGGGLEGGRPGYLDFEYNVDTNL